MVMMIPSKNIKENNDDKCDNDNDDDDDDDDVDSNKLAKNCF